jgi:hypothetical protein
MLIRPPRFAGVIAVVAVAVLAACDTTMTSPANVAHLRVVNATPGVVDILLDGAVVLHGLGGETVSPMIAVGAGARSVELRPAGSTASGTPVPIMAVSGQLVTLASTPNAANGMQVDVVLDTGATPASGMTKLRVLHLAPSVPVLAVWRTQPDFGTPVSIMFPFAYRASSSFVQSTPGVWEVRVWADSAGTGRETATGSWAHALAALTVDVPAGTARTMAVMDGPTGLRIQLLPEN